MRKASPLIIKAQGVRPQAILKYLFIRVNTYHIFLVDDSHVWSLAGFDLDTLLSYLLPNGLDYVQFVILCSGRYH